MADGSKFISLGVSALLVIGPLLMVATGMGLYISHPTSTSGCVDQWAVAGPFIGGSFLLVSFLLTLCISCDSKSKNDQPDGRLICSLALCSLYAVIASFVIGIYLLASVRSHGSDWLPSDINSTTGWRYNKRCLYNSNVCNHLHSLYVNDTSEQFSARTLTPVQFGCCKPPEDCLFAYQNPTTWIKTAKNSSYAKADCLAWDNDPTKLCYNCHICKMGVAHEAKKQRTVVGAATLAGSLAMILAFFILIVGSCYKDSPC